ncbi:MULTISPECIES: hypothetical protein [Thiorhodovibrio]|uniref:hypothetical protein n=1 Tax=Thiorhodovibrio TaxID=61593 RepID=UPI0019131613|nr:MULTISPECIES: hypothetical protein [Thiorhodovibrio]
MDWAKASFKPLLRRLTRWLPKSSRARAMVAVGVFGLLVFSMLQLAFQSFAIREAQHRQQALNGIASDYAQSLQLSLTDALSALNALESILIMEDYNPRKFDHWGQAHTITHISPPQRRPGLDTAPEFC